MYAGVMTVISLIPGGLVLGQRLDGDSAGGSSAFSREEAGWRRRSLNAGSDGAVQAGSDGAPIFCTAGTLKMLRYQSSFLRRVQAATRARRSSCGWLPALDEVPGRSRPNRPRFAARTTFLR